MWVGDGEQKNHESKPGEITVVENGIVVTECAPCVRGICGQRQGKRWDLTCDRCDGRARYEFLQSSIDEDISFRDEVPNPLLRRTDHLLNRLWG